MSKEGSWLDNVALGPEEVDWKSNPNCTTASRSDLDADALSIIAEEALRSPPSYGSERNAGLVMVGREPRPLKFRPLSDITAIEAAWLAHFFASLSALATMEEHEAWPIIQRHFEEVDDDSSPSYR